MSAAGSSWFAAVVSLLERLGRAGPHVLPVLTYHRVADPAATPSLAPGLVSATPDEFARQVADLAARRRIVGVDEVLEARRRGAVPGGPALLLTFDDAYVDFAEHAWPVLRRLGVPATLFVPTGYPDRPALAFWWDRLHAALAGTSRTRIGTPVGRLDLDTAEARAVAYRRLRSHVKGLPHDEAMAVVQAVVEQLGEPAPTSAVLGWADLRRLAAEGVTLAPHSRSHAMLDRVGDAQLDDEVRGSRADLEREVASAPPVFAYPSGRFDDRVVAAVGRAGYEVAFTTVRGVNDLRRADWLRLRRINVGRRSPLPVLRAQLLPGATRVLRRVAP